MKRHVYLLIAGTFTGPFLQGALGDDSNLSHKTVSNSPCISPISVTATQDMGKMQGELAAEQMKHRKEHLAKAGFANCTNGVMVKQGVSLRELTVSLQFRADDLKAIPSCPPHARMYNVLTPFGAVLLTFRGKGSDRAEDTVADARINVTINTNVTKSIANQEPPTRVRIPQEKPTLHE